MKRRWKKRIWWLVVPLALAIAYPFRYEIIDEIRSLIGWSPPADPRPAGISDLAWCEQNYADEVAEISNELDIPYAYLMALIVLECSGNKPAGHRFERHVKKQLTK
ncbi:MAG: hypothetical protein JNM00_12670, partial [Flavobacteriales bacterium]|nr:hypothetical protein [Flavobacteriales bacterium]